MSKSDKLLLDNYVNLMFGEFNDIAKKYQMAPLILAFSVIEASAKLSAPENKLNPRDRFIWWINEFLRNEDESHYPALDLYGARCGLFHEYGAESDLSRAGKCKVIAWTAGKNSQDHHNKSSDTMIILSKEKFCNDLTKAGMNLLKRLESDKEINKRFSKRLPNIFGVKLLDK